ncbi:hypothetical protein FVE85_5946 [Porphyridium purpureum]|uniref:Suppressor of disruption of TFIIS n=1 Tax=Porphyridium purpureum TaxID=35688 RepID=A0A5J4Z3A8_PORPP|nr:hypothetical protein FVE85_5946 [Porphyridium purpureum]|eukprot:POR5201..scf295_1
MHPPEAVESNGVDVVMVKARTQDAAVEGIHWVSERGVFCAGTRHELDTLWLDLDDTLYPRSCGVAEQVRVNIDKYILRHILDTTGSGNVSPELVLRAEKMREELFLRYGTTLRGLQEKYHVDAHKYWDEIHAALPYASLIHPDPALEHVVSSAIPLKNKWILTNADAAHVRAVLSALHLAESTFTGVIDVEAMQFANKPEPIAFQRALALSRAGTFAQCLFLDDSVRNVRAAQQLGVKGVIIGDQFCQCELAHLRDAHQASRVCTGKDPTGGAIHGAWSLHDFADASKSIFFPT